VKHLFTALVVTAIAAGSASAGKPSKPHSNNNGGSKPGVVISVSNYSVKFGTKFSGGLCYRGKNHCHWAYECYWPKYRCTCYWDPCTSCYYYWCETDGCYYPVSYIKTGAPLIVVAPKVVVAPPAGIPELPD